MSNMQGNHAQQSQSEPAERLQRFKAMLRTDPGNQRLVRQCIDLAVQVGDYDFVMEHTAAVLAASPADTQAQFDRATALLGMRDFAAASELLGAVLDREPQLAAARFNLALCRVCQSDYAAARPHLDALYSAGERPPGLLRLLISTYHHLGLVDEAVVIADENPEPAANDSATAAVYALLYLDAGVAEQAERWAKHALERQPDSLEALVTQATVNAAEMRMDEARSQYERVLQLAPANGRAWIGLGSISLLQNDFAGAKTQLARGVELMPAHVGSWHVLAWTNLLAGEIEEAERGFKHALEMDRNFAETHGALAAVAALRGDRAAAQRGIDVALRLDPQCLAAQFARSVLVGSAGDPAAAQRIIRRTLAGLAQSGGPAMSRMIERARQR